MESETNFLSGVSDVSSLFGFILIAIAAYRYKWGWKWALGSQFIRMGVSIVTILVLFGIVMIGSSAGLVILPQNSGTLIAGIIGAVSQLIAVQITVMYVQRHHSRNNKRV